MNAPSDFRAASLKLLEAKCPMPVAFAIGSHPADFVGSQILLPASDELALIGGVRGSAVPIVRCRTIDQFVAANAEIVLEDLIDAAGYVESEGPYGEYLGYYGRLKRNPPFRIIAQILIIVAAASTAAHLGVYQLLFIFNLLLLVIGSVVEPPAAILMLTPLFAPIMQSLGVDLVHFGIIVTVNLSIGMYSRRSASTSSRRTPCSAYQCAICFTASCLFS